SPAITTAYAPFVTTWKTDNDGTSAGNQITIPPNGDGYDYYASWVEVPGPGGADPEIGGSAGPFAGDATIDFPAPGTYAVRIGGAFRRCYRAKSGDRLKRLTFGQWGDLAWSSREGAFWGASNLTYHAADDPDLGRVTSMELMFAEATSFNGNIGG